MSIPINNEPYHIINNSIFIDLPQKPLPFKEKNSLIKLAQKAKKLGNEILVKKIMDAILKDQEAMEEISQDY